jgi:hypothetical protein
MYRHLFSGYRIPALVLCLVLFSAGALIRSRLSVAEELAAREAALDEATVQWLGTPNQPAIRRIGAKELVVQELAAGRITLLQAAARFRDINADWPEYAEVLRHRYPDASEEASISRNTIDYVCNILEDEDLVLAKGLRARLEAELDQLRQAGTLRLPT